MPDPSRPTIKRLFAVSGNCCAFPGCPRPLIDPVTGTVTAKVCHITAKKKDGPRYDQSLSDTERNGFDNLLLLCGEHHDIVDSRTSTYSVEDLCRIKSEHERMAGKAVHLDDSIVELFVRLFLSFQGAGGSPGAVYEYVPVKPIGWLGTAGKRLKFVRGAHGVGLFAAVVGVGTWSYSLWRFGLFGTPEWLSILPVPLLMIGISVWLASEMASKLRPNTYHRFLRQDLGVNGEGVVYCVKVAGECGVCGGELRLQDSPSHRTESVVGICMNYRQHVFTFDPTILVGERTHLPKPRSSRTGR